MSSTKIVIIAVIIIVLGTGVYTFTRSGDSVIADNRLNDFGFDEEESAQIDPPSLELDAGPEDIDVNSEDNSMDTQQTTVTPAANSNTVFARTSSRKAQTTGSVTHSIPLREILGGGPPKDGIPSIDDPEFESARSANLDDSQIGLGLNYKGEVRFYPFEILVWHELANDTVAGDPLLVTYCPLCQTAIVFDRRIDGVAREFGVSGLLWQSNLLMYDRAPSGNGGLAQPEYNLAAGESLWSQVLGEAVVGPQTGTALPIVSSDVVNWGDWRRAHPDTTVLKRPGILRPYGTDPYGDYYTNTDVGFGAAGADLRGVHPKVFTHGIEVNGAFKAYESTELPVGITKDTFAGETITIEKSAAGEVDFFITDANIPLSTVDGFWFSWVAVHPDTELWQGN